MLPDSPLLSAGGRASWNKYRWLN